jgi:cytoskeletal protein RodZ
VNWSFVRREWGAVTFVVTVALGIVIVPAGLYFGNQSPTTSASSAASAATVTVPTSTASAPQTTSTASAPRTASPSPTR